jgi:mono/diheme cytochrome c family protein
MNRTAQTFLAAGLVGAACFVTVTALTAQGPSTTHGEAMTTAVVQDDMNPDVYATLCASCHGSEGKGDGMAAAAFDPKPTDFTDSEFQAGRTDDDLAKAIAEGSGMMAGFGQQLSAEEIQSLVEYIRELGQ